MDAIWETVKEWAMKPVFGVPLVAVVGVVGAAAYMLLGRKKSSRKRLF